MRFTLAIIAAAAVAFMPTEHTGIAFVAAAADDAQAFDDEEEEEEDEDEDDEGEYGDDDEFEDDAGKQVANGWQLDPSGNAPQRRREAGASRCRRLFFPAAH